MWRSKVIPVFFKYGFAGLALFFLLRAGGLDLKQVAQAMTQHPGLTLAAFMTYALGVNGLAFTRWFWLLRTVGVEVPMRRALNLHFVGVFFNAVLPGGTAGDLAKGYYLFQSQDRSHSAKAVASLVLDRITGLSGLLLLGFLGLLSFFSQQGKDIVLMGLTWALMGIALALCVFTVIALNPHWSWLKPIYALIFRLPGGSALRELSSALTLYRDRPGVLVGAIGISVCTHALLASLYIYAGAMLHVPLSWSEHLQVVPTLTLLNGLPIAPAGIGVGEAAGEWLYGRLGVQEGSEILAIVHTLVIALACIASLAHLRAKR